MNNSEHAFVNFENYEGQFEELKKQLNDSIDSTKELDLIGINELESKNNYLEDMEKTVELLLDNINKDYRETGNKGTEYLVQYANLIAEIGEFVKKLGDFSKNLKEAYAVRENLRVRLNKECQTLDKNINDENAKIGDALYRIEKEEQELSFELTEADRFYHESEKELNEKYSELLKENLVPITNLYDDYIREIDVLIKGGKVSYSITEKDELVDLRKATKEFEESQEQELPSEEEKEEVSEPSLEEVESTEEELEVPTLEEEPKEEAEVEEEEVMPVDVPDSPAGLELPGEYSFELPSLSDDSEPTEESIEEPTEEVEKKDDELENPLNTFDDSQPEVENPESSFTDLFPKEETTTSEEDDLLGNFEGFSSFEDVLNTNEETPATEVPTEEPVMEESTLDSSTLSPVEPTLEVPEEPVAESEPELPSLESNEPGTEMPTTEETSETPEMESTYDSSALESMGETAAASLDKFTDTKPDDEIEVVVNQKEASADLLSKIPVDAAKAFMADKLDVVANTQPQEQSEPTVPEAPSVPTTKTYYLHDGETLSAEVTDDNGERRNVEIDYSGEKVVKDLDGNVLNKEYIVLESEMLDGDVVKKVTSDHLSVPVYNSELDNGGYTLHM